MVYRVCHCSKVRVPCKLQVRNLKLTQHGIQVCHCSKVRVPYKLQVRNLKLTQHGIQGVSL